VTNDTPVNIITSRRKYGDVWPVCRELTKQTNAPHAKKMLKMIASTFRRSHELSAGTAKRIKSAGRSQRSLRAWMNQKYSRTISHSNQMHGIWMKLVTRTPVRNASTFVLRR